MREEEIWVDIEGYEGLYQVSNMGRVKSLERTVWSGLNGGFYKTIPERILKPYDNNKEYLRVMLCKDDKSKQYLVHRLVAAAFIPNPTNLPEINHKDENPKNNCMNNLEWCSRSYNNNYGTRNKRAGKKIAEKLSKPIYSINKVSGLIMYWNSAKEASRVLGISQSHICNCLKGRKKSAGNFYWYYADEE